MTDPPLPPSAAMRDPVDTRHPAARVTGPRIEMTSEELALRDQVVEEMWQYDNRQGRSAQVSLGPSELGEECERKIHMRINRAEPVNHTKGVNWAAIQGTGVHLWLAAMTEWTSGDTGRYLTEVPVVIRDSPLIKGTVDRFDRLKHMVIDWKNPGERRIKDLFSKGPSEKYLIQGQLYGLGMARAGEIVERIATVHFPRGANGLDGLYVHIERYDPRTALAALDRYDRILRDVRDSSEIEAHPSPLCKWCPFYGLGIAGACPGE